MTRPLITVAVCTYNGEEYLAQTLDSILAQDYPNYEIVIVDDGSRDGTVSVIEDYARSHSRIRPFYRTNHGLAASRNFAFANAKGEWIAIIDQDDLCYPARLSVQMDIAESNPSAGLIFCNTDYIDEANRVIGNHLSGFVLPERVIERIDAANLLLRFGCYIDSEACFIRRKTVEKVGLLDEALVYACDYDYFIRAGMEVDFAYTSDTLAAWRIHARQATKTYRKIGKEIRRVFWRHCWVKDVAPLTSLVIMAKIAKSLVGDTVRRFKR